MTSQTRSCFPITIVTVQIFIVYFLLQADELSCELQCILREGLSHVIEYEMKEAYGADMWYVSSSHADNKH